MTRSFDDARDERAVLSSGGPRQGETYLLFAVLHFRVLAMKPAVRRLLDEVAQIIIPLRISSQC